MSIAITAPQKFDFQDLACIELMLRFAASDSASFFVEPKDGEDGELHLQKAGGPLRLEVQVKGASGTVTLEALASYLAHTPARRADHTLLERLIADTSRMAVLVMSRARQRCRICLCRWQRVGRSLRRMNCVTFRAMYAIARERGLNGERL